METSSDTSHHKIALILWDLKLDHVFSNYLKDLLTYAGFDFRKLEDFAQTDDDDERKSFFGIYFEKFELFKIVESRRNLLSTVAELCQVFV